MTFIFTLMTRHGMALSHGALAQQINHVKSTESSVEQRVTTRRGNGRQISHSGLRTFELCRELQQEHSDGHLVSNAYNAMLESNAGCHCVTTSEITEN